MGWGKLYMRKICSLITKENMPYYKDCATAVEPKINRVK